MDRKGFIAHLRAGGKATDGIRAITGAEPFIVTIAEFDQNPYIRYGVTLAGGILAALVTLSVSTTNLSADELQRIKDGEPIGGVIPDITRKGSVDEYTIAVRAVANLKRGTRIIGYVEEIFTHSLFEGKM